MPQARRMGVLIPPANIVCEMEYAGALPPGVSVHFQRLQRAERGITAASLVAMKDSVEQAAATLAMAPLDVVAYACTSGSFLSGDGLHDEIATRIAAEVALPAVTTSTAVLLALRAVQAAPVFVITPYPVPITAQSVAFLTHNGVDVCAHFTFDRADSAGIRAVTAEQIRQAARTGLQAHPAARGVFICCTNLPSLGAIASLESELGVPVVSSNSATVWAAARTAGWQDPLPALGRLGRSHLTSAPDLPARAGG